MQPRPEVVDLAPVFHGGAPPGHGAVLDFSVCSNPLGPSPRARAAVKTADIGRYPEPGATALARALAARHGVAPDQVLVGNGTAELLWLLALAYLRPGDRVLIVGPTFGEYARAARLMGALVHAVDAAAADDFRPSLLDIARQLDALQPRLLFLCNPNNPTGHYLDRDAMAWLLARTPGLLVLDEAYAPFVEGAWDARALLGDPRLVLLRSLTKDHALAGLRLGYALGAASAISYPRAVQPPWSVNAAAQAAGLAVLDDDAHVARGRALARAALAYLAAELGALGYPCHVGAANFLLAKVGDAARFTAALLAEGVYVRDCTSFGLPDRVRIAARPLADCATLVGAVRRLAVGVAR